MFRQPRFDSGIELFLCISFFLAVVVTSGVLAVTVLLLSGMETCSESSLYVSGWIEGLIILRASSPVVIR